MVSVAFAVGPVFAIVKAIQLCQYIAATLLLCGFSAVLPDTVKVRR